MKKKLLIVIDKCEDCVFFDFDNQDFSNWWGKARCKKMNKELPAVENKSKNEIEFPIPEFCSLENA